MAEGKQIPLKEAIIFGAFLSMSIIVSIISSAYYIIYQDKFDED